MKSKRALYSWVLYDLANTIFSGVVITFSMVAYADEIGGRKSHFTMVNALSTIVAAVLVPWLGARADKRGKHRAYLKVWTMLCIGSTLLMSVSTKAMLVVAALFAANLAYQTALAFYNSLLPVVADESDMGRASGLGVGVGYVGLLVAIPLALALERGTGTMRWNFVMTAIAFFVCALPCFFWVPESPAQPGADGEGGLLATLKRLPSTPAVLYFLIANFFVVDVLNTAIVFARDFIDSAFMRPDNDSVSATVLFLTNAAALGGGLFIGWLSDRTNPRRAFVVSLVCLAVTITAAATVTNLVAFSIFFVLFGAIGLAGVWTSGRKLLYIVAPKDRIGEYFGLYGVTQKVSMIGCNVVALIVDRFSTPSGYRAAIATQLVPLAIGLYFIMKVKLPGSGVEQAGATPGAEPPEAAELPEAGEPAEPEVGA